MINTYILFDLETSGLDPDEGAEIVQLSAKAINASTLEYVPVKQLTLLLKPLRPEKASPRAIDVIGKDLWESAQKEGLDPSVALKRLIEWIRQFNPKNNKYNRPIMCGHNIGFDYKFLMKTLLEKKIIKTDDEFPFSTFFQIDTMILLHLFWGHLPDTTDLKLDTLLSITGNQRATANHDAEEDVSKNADALVRILKFMRECQRRMRRA